MRVADLTQDDEGPVINYGRGGGRLQKGKGGGGVKSFSHAEGGAQHFVR